MENFPTVSQPYNLDVQLYPHQLTSVYWMEELEKTQMINRGEYKIHTKIGVNGDITGYGKTISMIALILRDKMSWDLNSPYSREKLKVLTKYYKKDLIEYYPRINTTLILVNKTMCKHWEKELSFSNLKYISVTKISTAQTLVPSDYDVVVVIPSMYNHIIRHNKNIVWKRFIFDEPSSVKVPSMLEIITGFTWLITATPEDIYTKHRKCKSFMKQMISPDFNMIRDDITIKNDIDYVKSSYTLPKTNHVYYKCFSPIFKIVDGIVDDKLLKIIESGNIDYAIQTLGGTQTDNIVELVRKNKLIELEEITSRIKIWKLRNDEEKVKEWEEKESRITKQLSELDKRFSEILNSTCSICYDNISNPVLEPNCHNIFCTKCLLGWLCNKNNCPLCRKDVSTDKLIYIKSSENKISNENKREPSKEEVIINTIKNKPDRKYIIFSDYFESFYSIRKILNENNINFVEIKGTVIQINNSLEKFKNGNINVVFLNSKSDNSGLNLQNTTDIILYHTLNESITKQVIGRANRIGRTEELFVHHLLF